MTIRITPDANIPLPMNPTEQAKISYRERATAAMFVIKDMIASGGEVKVTEDNREQAREAVFNDKKIPITTANAGALLQADALLTKYDFELLDAAKRVNNYVVHRLLIETDDADPRIRLKALELLGKSSLARVFTENISVDVTHRTVQDVDADLKLMAQRYIKNQPIEDLEVKDLKDE